MSGRLTLLAVLVPVLGLAVLVGRAEYAVRNGRVWTIPIEGYDPRDLLHGQYLEYTYRWNWLGYDTCGTAPGGDHTLTPGCCLCLDYDDADGFDPYVHQRSCEEAAEQCDASLHSESVMGPQRYFVPEDRARELESALRDYDAAIQLTAGPTGEPAVGELLLERRPWRDVLGP